VIEIMKKGEKMSDEQKLKMSETRKRRGVASGEKNPMYGRSGILSPVYGKSQTPEHKKKIGDAQKGEKNHMFDKKGTLNPNYGKHPSEATRKKQSEGGRGKHSGKNNPMWGKKRTPEWCIQHSKDMKGRFSGEKNPFYGKKHTPETIKYLSDITSGENHPQYGKHRLPNTVKKISEKNKGRPSPMKGNTSPMFGKHHTPESIIKMSKSQQLRTDHNKGGNTPHTVTIALISSQLERLGWKVQSWSTTGERFVIINGHRYSPDIYATRGNEILIIEVGGCDNPEKLPDLMTKYAIVLQVPKMSVELRPIDLKDLVNWQHFSHNF
jgi:hypothetical protein